MERQPGTSPAPAAHRAVIFAVVSLGLLMTSLDSTIVATALHALQQGLGTSISWAGWTITSYSLGLVLMLPLSGRISDQYGRRRVFLGSIVVFTLASLCCGLADDIYLLVALRFVQAIGGAGFTPSATGIVVDHFGAARDKAVGLFGSIFPIGAMIGPILGGVFVTYWTWRGAFLVNVPIGVLLIPLCLRFVPADGPRLAGRATVGTATADAPRTVGVTAGDTPAADQGTPRPRRLRHVRHGAFDLTGLTLLGVGLLAAMVGLTYLGGAGALWLSVGSLVLAAVALGMFARHIARAPDPIIPPRLIHGRGFGAVNVINILYGGAIAGLLALLPLYATTRFGIGPLGSGTLLIAQGVAVVLFSTLAAMALRRTGYRQPLYIGSVVAVAGMVALAVTPIGLSPYGWLAAAAGVTGIGMGWFNPASRNAGLQLAPEQSASLAGLRTTGRQIGTIAAISVATAVIDHAGDPGVALAWVYAISGAVLLLALPVISRVPEHRGAW